MVLGRIADYDAHAWARARGAQCDGCALDKCRRGPVRSRPGGLPVITDAPSAFEVEAGVPCVEPASCAIVYVAACAPPPGRTLAEYELWVAADPTRGRSPTESCRGRLASELAEHHTEGSTLLTYGSDAMAAVERLLGLPTWPLRKVSGAPRAIPSGWDGGWLLPTLHPRDVRAAKQWTHVLREDVARAEDIRARGAPRWAGDPAWTFVRDAGDWARFAAACEAHTGELVLDCETDSPDPHSCRMYCVGLRLSGGYWVLPVRRLSDGELWWGEDAEGVRAVVRRLVDRCELVGQYLGFDQQLMLRLGYQTRLVPCTDTQVLHKATYENDLPHDLGFIARRITDAPIWKLDPSAKDTARSAKDDYDLALRCIRDVHLTGIAATKLRAVVRALGTEPQYQVDTRNAFIGLGMSQRGLLIPDAALADMSSLVAGLYASALGAWQAAVPGVSPTSWRQVQALVYGAWGYWPVLAAGSGGDTWDEAIHGRTEGGTSVAALTAVMDAGVDPEHAASLELLFEVKALLKVRGYLAAYAGAPSWPHAAGYRWVRPRWNADVVPTGRLSSAGPNLQNVPTVSRGGVNLRGLFVAPPGYVYVGADYSQVELRLYAVVAEDADVLQVLADGRDPHSWNAATIFAESVAEQESWYERIEAAPKAERKYFRDVAKKVAFTELYGGGAAKLHVTLRQSRERGTGKRQFPNVTPEESLQWHERWHSAHPETKRFQQAAAAECRALRYASEPYTHRRRYFIDGTNQPNAIPNMRIQGAAAGMCNEALDTLAQVDWSQYGVHAGLVVQIHDYVGVVVEEAHAATAVALIESAMHKHWRGLDFPAVATVTKSLGDQ